MNIIVPPLGESISEATVAAIKKSAGSGVKSDELIIELETDKVTLEINAPTAGSIDEILVKEGDTVTPGQIIGKITPGAGTSSAKIASQPQKSNDATSHDLSPSVRRISTENSINPSDINGTGKDGRITKGDALAHIESKLLNKTDSIDGSRIQEAVRISKLRQTVARRLKESQNTAAILTTFNEVDMSAVMELRKKYQEQFTKKYGMKLGFMSFFIKAVTTALREIPSVNAEIRGDEIVYRKYADVGVAVGTENGLVVPVIKNADTMSLFELEKSVVDYGNKAREGKITIADLTGGTFTISNGGVYGSLLSTPIINPPQSGILGMHSIQDRPVAINGQVVIRPMMYIALSYDHRLIDGKEAVTFLVLVKQMIEDPVRLVLGL